MKSARNQLIFHTTRSPKIKIQSWNKNQTLPIQIPKKAYQTAISKFSKTTIYKSISILLSYYPNIFVFFSGNKHGSIEKTKTTIRRRRNKKIYGAMKREGKGNRIKRKRMIREKEREITSCCLLEGKENSKTLEREKQRGEKKAWESEFRGRQTGH